MRYFHVYVHPRPDDAVLGTSITVDGDEIETLDVPPSVAASGSFPISFEEACDGLNLLSRIHVEPDGFFIWCSARSASDWQVNGHLLDRNDRLVYVELSGTCPRQSLSELLMCFGLPLHQIMFQLVQQAVYVTWEDLSQLM